MFVKTVKLKKPNPIAIIVVVAAVLILAVVWVIGSRTKGASTKYAMADNTQRVAFLKSLGWEVSEKETDCKVIKVPSDFNSVYNAYNKMQKQQGFDLSKHKGETVEIYTYDVYNYPEKPDNIVAHIIVNNKMLIAGDVCSTDKDGFIHGLMPVNKEGMNKDNDKSKDAKATTPPPVTQSPATDSVPDTTTPPTTTTVPDNNGGTKSPDSSKVPETTKAPDNAGDNNGGGFFFTTK